MRESTQESRQLIGCGYEPPPDKRLLPLVRAWDHPGREKHEGEPDVCPGYACSLPEVVEATWAYRFFDKGELSQFCGGQATQLMLDCLKIYDGERARCQSWEVRNPEKS